MANRVKTLVFRVGVNEKVCMTRGVAKNTGVLKSIEDCLGMEILPTIQDPQLSAHWGRR